MILPVRVRLGKRGLSKNVIEEIKINLKKHKIVKIRFLKNYPFSKDKKTEAERIAYLCNSELVNVTGMVFVIRKKSV